MGTTWVSFDGKDCSGCKHLNERDYCEFTACVIPCTVRATIPDVKLQTNADRIRNMTDEELAVLLEGCICPKEPCPDIDRATEPDKKRCTKCWLDWLRQEAQDAGDGP